ncbi:MAG: glutaredoxin family protein [Coriobacteriales bacterium]|jgi:glutaredoxin 3
MKPELSLVVMPFCPYCNKVLRFMKKRGIEIEVKSTDEPGVRDFLVERGGKFQAPCLFIDGEALYESDDIIVYLDKAFSA